MLHILFKNTNTKTKTGISNLKDEIEKMKLYKFGINVKYILYDIYSKLTIIINKVGHHED